MYIGRGRALVKLPTGEILCVDTNSKDSLDYLLGFEMEADVFPVFRRFLQHNSTVLDIGANVGLYSVTTASIVKDHGCLYAFEANPYTYAFLDRSAYCNQLLNRPNLHFVNALVGAEAGQGTLYFDPEFLGGASMSPLDQQRESVDLPLICLDQFLPPDLVVDLIKIDVEGYEPFVIEGLRNVLARSPGVRLVIEFFESMLVNTYGVEKFVGLINELGFRMCRILPGANLELLAPGQMPQGSNYFLLTRTPEEDIRRHHFRILPEGLRYLDCFYEGSRNRLIHGCQLVCTAQELAAVDESVIFFGPYINLAPGQYSFSFQGTLEGALRLKFTKNFGEVLGETTIQSFADPVQLELDATAEKFEIVACQTESFVRLEVSEIDVAKS
jgi:FkbM family methyltransferase